MFSSSDVFTTMLPCVMQGEAVELGIKKHFLQRSLEKCQAGVAGDSIRVYNRIR